MHDVSTPIFGVVFKCWPNPFSHILRLSSALKNDSSRALWWVYLIKMCNLTSFSRNIITVQLKLIIINTSSFVMLLSSNCKTLILDWTGLGVSCKFRLEHSRTTTFSNGFFRGTSDHVSLSKHLHLSGQISIEVE